MCATAGSPLASDGGGPLSTNVPLPLLSFMGQTVPNHSYVDLSLVGTSDSNSVQCHTHLGTCCNNTEGSHRGDWYFPNGSRLLFSSTGGDIFEQRVAQRVDIHRRYNATSPSGIYRCDIPTDAVYDNTGSSVRDTVYVGLYTKGGGIAIQILTV